jgi:hypothetical protein
MPDRFEYRSRYRSGATEYVSGEGKDRLRLFFPPGYWVDHVPVYLEFNPFSFQTFTGLDIKVGDRVWGYSDDLERPETWATVTEVITRDETDPRQLLFEVQLSSFPPKEYVIVRHRNGIWEIT